MFVDNKGNIAPKIINLDGSTIINPSKDLYLHAGYIEYTVSEEQQLKNAKENEISIIETYDSSSNVNSFSYQGLDLWIDKATRVGLVNAANASKALGNTEITVGIDGISVTLPIDSLIGMLYLLEMYALECYNVTLQHKNNVEALTSIDLINKYDYTTGYPEKLTF